MYAVLLLPHFRLQSVLRFREEGNMRPFALIDAWENRAVILEANPMAQDAGVRPGQTSPQALARCPSLVIVPRSIKQERNAQAALVETALRFSPEVESTADGYCTINLSRVRRTDWRQQMEAAVQTLAGLHLSAQAGVGTNPDLAFLAAHHARPVLVVSTPAPFLAGLAIHELDPSPELLSVLREWGIHHLGQLASIPRGELMNRLGLEADRLWERAAGGKERPLRLVKPVEEFVESYEFEQEIDTAAPALFLLRRFLDHLTLRLENTGMAAGRMKLLMPLSDGSRYEREFTVPSPTTNVDVLFRIVETHFENLQLDVCPCGVSLQIDPAHRERRQFQLFETPLRDPNRFGETLGRLAALVGTENVGVMEPLDTYKPDSFQVSPPRFQEKTNISSIAADPASGLPLRRYRPPFPAEVRVVRYQPVAISSDRVTGKVKNALGPYRASGGWWEPQGWAHEEWDVELERGGLYRLSCAQGEWRIEGSYDEPAGRKAPTGIVSFPRKHEDAR